MEIRPFLLERYFARYEFVAPHLLASSDCEALTLEALLERATAAERSAWSQLRLGYTESAGHPELRARIAALYPGLSANEIVTAAPEEIIYLVMRTLLSAGDRVVVTFPGYQSLYEIAAAMGCEVVRWQATEQEDRWTFEVSELEALLTAGTKALIVNFPHNPTGSQPDLADWERIVQLARRNDVWLISDEMYRGLEAPGQQLPPAARYDGRTMSIAGLSKAYGLAGLRCGWLASRDAKLLRAVQQYKDYTTICSSAPAEWLSTLALGHGEALRARARSILSGNQELLRSFFQRQSRWFAPRWPAAGPVCFPRWRGRSSAQLCDQSANRAGVMLLPSEVYEAGDHHLRFGFGRSSFAAALAEFEKFLEAERDTLE